MMQRGTVFARPSVRRDASATRRLTDKQAIAFALHYEPLRRGWEERPTLRFPAPAFAILDAARRPANEDDLVEPLPF